VEAGVPKAAVIDGRDEHSLLFELFTSSGSGTEVTA
jgi:acetylglutamate kinase